MASGCQITKGMALPLPLPLSGVTRRDRMELRIKQCDDQDFKVGSPERWRLKHPIERGSHGVDQGLGGARVMFERAARRCRGDTPPVPDDVIKAFRDEVLPRLCPEPSQRVRYAQLIRQVQSDLETHHAPKMLASPFLGEDAYCDFRHTAVQAMLVDVLKHAEHDPGPDVQAWVKKQLPQMQRELAALCFAWVRDHIAYELGAWRRAASEVIAAGTGSCSSKALVLIALFRAMGFPAGMAMLPVRNPGYLGMCVGPLGWVYDSLRTSTHFYAMVWLPNDDGITWAWHRVDCSDDSPMVRGLLHDNWPTTRTVQWDGNDDAVLTFSPDCMPSSEQWHELLALAACDKNLGDMITSWSAIGPVAGVSELLGGRVPSKARTSMYAWEQVLHGLSQKNVRPDQLFDGSASHQHIVDVVSSISDEKSKLLRMAANGLGFGHEVDPWIAHVRSASFHLVPKEPFQAINTTLEKATAFWSSIVNDMVLHWLSKETSHRALKETMMQGLAQIWMPDLKANATDVAHEAAFFLGTVVGSHDLKLVDESTWLDCSKDMQKRALEKATKLGMENTLQGYAWLTNPEIRNIMSGDMRDEMIARLCVLGANQPSDLKLRQARIYVLQCALAGNAHEVEDRLSRPWYWVDKQWPLFSEAVRNVPKKHVVRWVREVGEHSIQVCLNMALDMRRALPTYDAWPFELDWSSLDALDDFADTLDKQNSTVALIKRRKENLLASGITLSEPLDLLQDVDILNDDDGPLAALISQFYLKSLQDAVGVSPISDLLEQYKTLFQFPHTDRDLLRFVYWLAQGGKLPVAAALLRRLSADSERYKAYGCWQQWNTAPRQLLTQIIVPVEQALDKHYRTGSPVKDFVSAARQDMHQHLGPYAQDLSEPPVIAMIRAWADRHKGDDSQFPKNVVDQWLCV